MPIVDWIGHKFYQVLCSYVHANYLGAGQTYDGEKIDIYPSERKVKVVLDYLTSVHIYLIECISDNYEIGRRDKRLFDEGSKVDELLEGFKVEKGVLDFFAQFLRELGMSEEQIITTIEEYKKHNLKTSKNKTTKKQKKKRRK